jgi:hypothetical protein
MYKVEIDISAWGGDEKVIIETTDFEKVQIIQEFLEMQMENGWAIDYVAVLDEEDEDLDVETEADVAQD